MYGGSSILRVLRIASCFLLKVSQENQGWWEGKGKEGQARQGPLFLGECYHDNEADLTHEKAGEVGGLGATVPADLKWDRDRRGSRGQDPGGRYACILPRLARPPVRTGVLGRSWFGGGFLSLCKPVRFQGRDGSCEVDSPGQSKAGWHQQDEPRDRAGEFLGGTKVTGLLQPLTRKRVRTWTECSFLYCRYEWKIIKMKNTIFDNILVFKPLINALKFLNIRRPHSSTDRSMLICKHVSLDFVSIFCGCRICAWSLKFYTNPAYSIHVREQKVGFGSGKKGSVWLQRSWICKWYFSCRFCKCKTKNNHLTQGQRLKCLNQVMNISK